MKFSRRSNVPIITMLLLLANQPVFAAVLDITNPEDLYQARTDYHQAAEVNKHLTEIRKSHLRQYTRLTEARVISEETGRVDPIFQKAIEIQPARDESDLFYMAQAFKALHQKPGLDATELSRATRALEFGTQAHQGIIENSRKKPLSEIINKYSFLLRFTSLHPGISFYETVLDADGIPVVYADKPINFAKKLPVLGEIHIDIPVTLCKNPFHKGLISFMQQCKTTLLLDKELEISETEDFDLALNRLSSQSIARPDMNLVYDRKTLPKDIDPIDFIFEKSEELQGAAFLIMFKGSNKYQYFTTGIFEENLNLEIVVNDKDPIPALSLSIPTDNVVNAK